MYIIFKVLIIFSDLTLGYKAARILAIYPTPSISHQVVFRPLTLALVNRGHQVVVLTPNPVFTNGDAPENLTEIDVRDLSYTLWRDEYQSIVTPVGNEEDLYEDGQIVFRVITKLVEKQFMTEDFQKILKDKTKGFELIMIEAFVRQALGVSHIYKAPVIQISSFGSTVEMLDIVGAPSHPIVYPTITRQKLGRLTCLEKIKEFYKYFKLNTVPHGQATLENAMSKRVFGADVPLIEDLKANVHMLFLNVHPIWEMNRPVPPNVVYVGGLHQTPEKGLPEDLKSYLDSSKHGVIYFSLGTNVEPALLPPERIQNLINVFSKLPYDILWKWNKDELPGRTENIRISKWLPQSDLLRHPKIKMFITQGGLQSTDEAITAGVPLIGIPMLGDQWYNVEQYVYHKIGLQVDMDTLTEEKFANAINTIINNESTYRENVAKLRSIMNDQPETSLERAVWWTEYVIRHSGARHLRAPSANMPLYQYFELELVAYLFLGLLSLLISIVYAFYFLFKVFKQYKSSIKIKNS